MPSNRHHNALVRLIAKYSVRLSNLYDKFVDKLVVLGMNNGITEEDPLFHFDNVPEAQGELKAIMQDYATEQLATYKSGIQSGVALAYNHDNANLTKYSILSNKAIQAARDNTAAAFFRNRMNPAQGLSLSQNVWNYTEQAKSEFEVAVGNVLADGIKGGKSAEDIGRQVRGYLNNPDMMYRRYHENIVENGTKQDVVYWRKRIVDEDGNVRFVKVPIEKVGQGQYRSARKNGLRLARTEINAAYHKANYDRWQQEPFVIGIRIFLSPQHPVYDICDPLEGNYPKDFLWMGWHPQCMCASAPITIEGEEKREFYRRMLRGEDMSKYESPNAIKDVPEAYKGYVRQNVDKIVDADLRGKLAWHLRDNRKYWENIPLIGSTGMSTEDPKVVRAREKFLSYGEEWEKAYFNNNNGGYNVYHKDHLFSQTKKPEARYTGGQAEKEVGKLLADFHAKQIEFLPEKGFEGKKADLYFDNTTWDIKYIPTANIETIRKYIRNGKKADNMIFYWDDKNRLHDLREAVDRTVGALKARGKTGTMPNIYYIGEDSKLRVLIKAEK